MKHRFAYLDVLRLLAVALVMFGHYVSVGGGATEIPGVINTTYTLPLIDQSRWQIWKFEIFMIEKFSTQTAILGVALFFLVTGYLMPTMLERYSRRDFLVNRFFRIFPVLFIGIIVIGIFVGVTQGISFDSSSYFASWTLTYQLFLVVPVAGVLWTLVVEILFYACSAMLGKFTVYKLIILQAVLLAIIFCSVKQGGSYYLMLAALQAKYLLMICIGSAINLAERETEWHHKFALIFGAIVTSYLGFQIYKFGHEDVSTYNNLGTHLLAFSLFLFFYWLSKLNLLEKLPNVIYRLADLVYPIYLLHVAIGLGTMAIVRGFTTEPYIMLAAAISASILVSWILHIFVENPGISLGKSLVRKHSTRVNS
jgi:peptidoglycan/LPS O-acetylase OafA/YrhL